MQAIAMPAHLVPSCSSNLLEHIIMSGSPLILVTWYLHSHSSTTFVLAMYLLCAVYSCRNFGQAAVPLQGIHLVCRSNTAGLEGCRVHRLLLWLSVHSKHDGRCPVVPDHIVVIWVQMVLTPRPAASVLHRGPASSLIMDPCTCDGMLPETGH
jgi:hypothetical protein